MTEKPKSLGKQQAFDPDRAKPRDERLSKVWRGIKRRADEGIGKPAGFKSYADLAEYMGEGAAGEAVALWNPRLPHGPGNTHWACPDAAVMALRKEKDKALRKSMLKPRVRLIPDLRPRLPVGRPKKVVLPKSTVWG